LLALGFSVTAPLSGVGGMRSAQAQFFFGWGDPSPPRPRRGIGEPRRQRGFDIPFFGPRYRSPPREEPRRRDAGRSDTRAPAPRKPDTEPQRHVVVFGDSMADWLGYGLEEAFADANELGVTRKNKAGAGLIRNEPRDYDWVQHVRETLAAEKADFVVMMIGLADRHAIRERIAAGQTREGEKPNAAARERRVSHEFRSEKWVELYSKQVDDVIAALKAKGAPVIWVGMPPIRGPKSRSDLSFLNDIYRERAERAGVVYVDVWEGFLDDNGDFSSFGPDVLGQVRRLRSGDGVHFTRPGARKLAHFVDREIKRLLNRETPVALPTPQEPEPGTPAQQGPAPRPVAGPVVPLTGGSPASEPLA
jgi:hypothetical protein